MRDRREATSKTLQQEINQYLVDQAWFVPMVYTGTNYASPPDKVAIPTDSDQEALHPPAARLQVADSTTMTSEAQRCGSRWGGTSSALSRSCWSSPSRRSASCTATVAASPGRCWACPRRPTMSGRGHQARPGPVLPVQYWDWLSGAVPGDLGESFYTGEAVTAALANRLPVTLTLVVLTLLLTAVLSVLLGVTAAVRGGWVDRVLQFVSVLGTAVPRVHHRDRPGVHPGDPVAHLPGHGVRVAGRQRRRAGSRRSRCR